MHDPYQPTCAGSFRGKGSKASAWSDSRPAESGKSAVCFRFFSVVLPLRKVAKQTAWTTRAVQIAVPHDANAVYPDAVDADRVGGEARVAPRQIEDAPVRPAVHARRVEEQEVGLVTGLQHPPSLDAEHRSRLAGQPAGSGFQRQHAELAHPVPEQVQPEAGVIEERKVRASIRQRHHAGGGAEHWADPPLVRGAEARP